MRRARVQAVDDVARSARFARWSPPVFAGLRIEGRIGLSPALLNSLAIARSRDSAP
jgi:hypothetical protein